MKFSPIAFILAFLLHGGGTILLFFMAIGTAMSAFTQQSGQVQHDMDALTTFALFWNPGPALLNRLFGVSPTIAVHFCWSIIVGILAGCIIPQLRRKGSGHIS